MSATDAALHNLDILHLIFDNFDTTQHKDWYLPWDCEERWPESNREVQSFLAGAARTCQAFTKPALNVLWEKMTGIVPLVKILPGLTEVENVYILENEIQSEDWTRFSAYAKRIRLMIMRSANGNQIDPSVYIRIAQLRENAPLFPALRVLLFAVDPYSNALLNYMSPALHGVYLSTGGSTQETPVVHTFIGELVGRTPHLRDLFIDAHLAPSIATDIPQLTTLKFLKLLGSGPNANTTLLHQLSTLDHLKKLHFNIDEPVYSSASVATITTTTGFSALKELTICGTIPEVTNALATLRDTGITELRVELSSDFNVNAVSFRRTSGACFEQIGRHFRFVKTLEIVYSILSIRTKFYPSEIINSFIEVLYPLLRLSHLEVVDLVGFPPCNMSADDIEKIASAWPFARSISLPMAVVLGHRQSLPSIAALSSFARRCPDLHSLSLVINACGDDTIPSPPIIPHHLEKLTLGGSWIDNPLVVAPYIGRAFPFLKHFEASRRGDYHMAWLQVAGWLYTGKFN